MWFLIAVAVVCSEISSVYNEDCPTVKTSYGKIRGTVLKARQDSAQQFYGFKGIPYAKPPTGKLRFQPPEDPEPWRDVIDATEYGNHCLQKDESTGSVVGNEDCLFIDVFTKKLNPLKLMPVIVWIHGGSHVRGWSNKNGGPDYLVVEDIVYVSMNFRLNIFGYFTVNDENAYGNNAIKDQIAGLKWIKKNIEKFGGDPNRVTILGESTGSYCVDVLQLSPRAKGLFQQAIMQSGTALSARYLQREPLEYAYRIAENFGILTESTKSIVEGLQNIVGEELTKAAFNSTITGDKMGLHAGPFFPIIEAENPLAIITKPPYEILESGEYNQVPYILTHTTGEDSLGSSLLKKVNLQKEDFYRDPEMCVSTSFNDPPNKRRVGEEIRDHFHNYSSNSDGSGFSKWLAQELFIRGIQKSLELREKHHKGYYGIFSYVGSYTSNYPGVGHAEDLQYILYDPQKIEKLTESDKLTRKRVVKLWSNFVKYGNPSPSEDEDQGTIWPHYDSDKSNCLNIGENIEMMVDPDVEDYKFWQQLFDQNAVKPLVTY